MSLFVLDNSISAAWCFEDQSTPYADAVLDALIAGAAAVVPLVWRLEVVNSLVVGERRKRIHPDKVEVLLRRMQKFQIEVETGGLDKVFAGTFKIARKYQRSAYDASYLELAFRLGLPLATKDEPLRKAALELGISIFQPA